MKSDFAVRATGSNYEVYRISTKATVKVFPWGRTESSRAKALGLANATREDMNRIEDVERVRTDFSEGGPA